MMHDPFDLARFVDAQRSVYGQSLDELKSGRKTSHWMWFIFPQIRGLAHSQTAERFAITGPAEARAYLQHDLLGQRLEECVRTVLRHRELSALQIFGSPDDLKFRSCLTLFIKTNPEYLVYQQALDQFYGGDPDQKTLHLLEGDTK